jgi:hypothetical protein
MENYFSQLLSRNTPEAAGGLQPHSLSVPESGGIDESFVEVSPGEPASPEKIQAPLLQLPRPTFENESQPVIEQKIVRHEYLQQYFTRADDENETKKYVAVAIPKPSDVVDAGNGERYSVADSKDSDDHESRDALQIISVKEVSTEKNLISPAPGHLSQPDFEPKSIPLNPTIWLSPPAAASAAQNPQAPLPPKPMPSLMIGKIVIELLPSRPVPPRTVNRSSPFQATGSKSSSSSLAFGLGQL